VNNNPMISVVMPVYNGGKYLDEAIQSILNQTYANFEFIIINDGSTDKSLEIIEKYKKQDERIILISRENRGLIASLNEGIDKARGKYIARMDADDISLPERFERQIGLMEEEKTDICGCHWLIMNEVGKHTDCFTVPLSDESFIAYLSYSVPFAHGSVMIRKSFLSENTLYYGSGNAQHAEDYEMWIRVYELNGRFSNVNDFLFKYRQFKQSLSQVNFKKNRADAKKLGKKFIYDNLNTVKNSIEILLSSELSKKEQELLLIASFRISFYLKSPKLLFTSLHKIDFKNLPSSLFKLLYIIVVD